MSTSLEMIEDYRHPKITDLKPLELDFFFPRYNLAFEYQVNITIAIFSTNRESNIIMESIIARKHHLKRQKQEILPNMNVVKN